jgi:RimJ/RimL family protein N-acetyltransferase
VKKIQGWFEKDLEKEKPEQFFFQIRTLDGDILIGFVGLFGEFMNHGDAWVGIGLGEREYWGRGYGTDTMRVILRYAFTELNLWRVTLGTFEYNPRAIHSYEKAGFTLEGRARKNLLRDGRRWDTLFMGILREEWEKRDDYD